MTSNQSQDMISDAGETTSNSTTDLPKKTAFDWKLFDNRAQVLNDLPVITNFITE